MDAVLDVLHTHMLAYQKQSWFCLTRKLAAAAAAVPFVLPVTIPTNEIRARARAKKPALFVALPQHYFMFAFILLKFKCVCLCLIHSP